MLSIQINRLHNKTLTKQVYEQIRELILKKKLKDNERLPSTRELAISIGVSRNVTLEAYEQLVAEGYLIVRSRSGTYVAPGASLQVTEGKSQHAILKGEHPAIKDEGVIDFRAGNPATDHFPRQLWGKLAKEVCLEAPDHIYGYNSSLGMKELRIVLSSYLSRTRNVQCHPDQIFITSGATQGLSLITDLLAKRENYVAVEDPVTDEMRNIFSFAGAKIQPVQVDEYGIIPEYLSKSNIPSFVFVIPSHQFPIGGTLPIQRRIQLIEYARKMNCYIVEDDYDSEFTYEGTAVNSMQGLDQERVIYVGTFSKILSPALRIGYVILPTQLIEKFKEIKWYSDRHSSSLEQLVLARFINEGYLDRHVRNMKKIYRKRRQALVTSLYENFNNPVILGQAAGMHLVVELAGVNFNDLLMNWIQNYRVKVYPVEKYAIKKGYHINRIIMGYGSLTVEDIQEGVKRLKDAIENYQQK
ncbi:PLP-dependent aminotransferase family protein [Neobacillus drentensis]|uniref:MocR-like pyridoxine biosynthesis transcription factor PdxR n=2 Tax=Neobacillus drentensis TaxID=220684 RepID=UPI003002B910